MNHHTLNDVRHGMESSFEKARDALASEAGARSFPERSFSPFFERAWASLHEALEDGRIDAEGLREVCVRFAPLPEPGQLMFLGIDTSNLSRPPGETAADRTLVKSACLRTRMRPAPVGSSAVSCSCPSSLVKAPSRWTRCGCNRAS